MKHKINTHETSHGQIFYVACNGNFIASHNANMEDFWQTSDLDSDEPDFNLFTDEEIDEILENI